MKPTVNGGLDFSSAYDVGIGAWDKFAAKWLYTEFVNGTDVSAALEDIIADGYASGLRFVSDREARSISTGNPFGAVWDNGADAAATLEETMAVREIALRNFGTRSLKDGQAVSDLNNIIVPIYLYHRYQVAAAAKIVGGLSFSYGVKGDALPGALPVAAQEQRRALAVLLETLDPAALDLSDSVINQLTPPLGRFGSFARSDETFDGNTGPVFDVLAAADISGSITINALLDPSRAARLVSFKRRNVNALGLKEVLDALDIATSTKAETLRQQAIADVLLSLIHI